MSELIWLMAFECDVVWCGVVLVWAILGRGFRGPWPWGEGKPVAIVPAANLVNVPICKANESNRTAEWGNSPPMVCSRTRLPPPGQFV